MARRKKDKLIGLSGSAKGVAVRVKGTAKQPSISAPQFAQPGAGEKRLVLNYVQGQAWRRLDMPWLPEEIQHDSIARVWEQVPRPGRAPLIYTTGAQLPTIAMTVLLKRTDDGSVQATVDQLRTLASDGTQVIATLGRRNMGSCQITGLSIRETDWEGEGYTIEAEADLELTAYPAAAFNIGPVPAAASKRRASNAARVAAFIRALGAAQRAARNQ